MLSEPVEVNQLWAAMITALVGSVVSIVLLMKEIYFSFLSGPNYV